MFTPIVTVPLLSLTSFYTIDTVTLVWNTKKLVTYTLPFNSPSLRKASRSNPHALFSNCMQNDVTSVHHSRSKTNKCILLRPTNNKDMKWDSCIQLLFSCRNWSAKKTNVYYWDLPKPLRSFCLFWRKIFRYFRHVLSAVQHHQLKKVEHLVSVCVLPAGQFNKILLFTSQFNKIVTIYC